MLGQVRSCLDADIDSKLNTKNILLDSFHP